MIRFDRRNLLRGLGVSIALPSFDSLHAANKNRLTANARRFVCVSPNYGMNPSGFFPQQAGADYQTPTSLKPLDVCKGGI